MVIENNEIEKLKQEIKSKLYLIKKKRDTIYKSQINLPDNKSQMALRRTFANLNGRNKRKQIQKVYDSYTKKLKNIKDYNKSLNNLNNKLKKINVSNMSSFSTGSLSTTQKINYPIPKLVLNNNKSINKMEGNIFAFLKRTKRKTR